MEEHIVKYESITIEDIEALKLYYEYICNGDKKQVIIKERENK